MAFGNLIRMTEADMDRRSHSGLSYVLFDTAFGACGLAWNDAGIVRLQLPERDIDATRARLCRRLEDSAQAEPTSKIRHVITSLQGYFDGRRTDFADVDVDLTQVGEFHARIYAALRGIGWGTTTTYGGLANLVGSPGAAQAVGQAMGRNPVPIIVPCHRVLAGGRRIGGFSAPGGAFTKERLLTMEGVRLGVEAPLLDLMDQPRKSLSAI
jgi:methylated-DNA-[protein]-cysteine S-methyltransferase